MQIRIANIIRGTLIGNTMSVLTRYISRVVNGGGIVEKPQCVETALNSQSILQQASLLVVPSGYKGGTLYSEIPTNGNGDLIWTRGGDAFRTNASGVIQRVPWNLFQRSEEFDNAVWQKSNATITINSTTAPNGTITADKVIENSLSGLHYVLQNISGIGGGTYTLSVYAKADTRSWIYLTTYDGITDRGAYFNLSTGAIGTVDVGATASIQSVGDGWYRCIVTATPTTTFSSSVQLATANNTRSYQGNGTSGIFIWGAQLVEGTTAQTYLPTTDRLNFPRLSYMYGSCPSALLEPQRTNLFTYSSQLDDVNWSKQNCTITANSSTAPDGTLTADLVDDGTAVSTQHWFFQNPTFANNTTYTISFYAKYVSRKYMSVNMFNGLTSQYVDYDIQNGSVFGSTGDVTASIINVGNGWYRVVYTRTTAITGTPNFRIAMADDTANESYTGSNKQVLIWGLQLELGAYVTTPIPTTSATATRVADSFSRSNIYTNGLISASGGTWFVELRNNIVYTRDFASRIGIGDTTGLINNSLVLNPQFGGGRALVLKYVAGVESILYSTTTNTVKIAIKWNGTSCDVFANGTKVASASAFTTTIMENLIGSAGVPYFIQQMALFPTPLSDTDCAAITSL